jgi:hypothetical protein
MSQSVIYQFLKAGSQTITVPSGYSNQVLVYAWGAGGGSGTGAPGGGGGYAAGVVSISTGSTVIVSVGGAGGSIVGRTAAGSLAGIGNNPIIDLSGGVGAPGGDPEDNDAGGAGGGGGASAVFVNGIPMIVAAGAGGGGGLGEDWGGGDPENGKGRPGGVATQVTTTPKGADGRRGGAGGAGGGGAGYPFGGASQKNLYGDDVYSISQGGFGGQNYANASVTSSSLLPGSGINTAGTTNGYYPGKSRGKAGYDGCVILVFQKLFTAWIKQAGDWKQVTSAYVKTPDTTVTTYSTAVVPVGSVYSTTELVKTFEWKGSYAGGTAGTSSAQLWTVPTGVTSLTVTAIGGGGSGGATASTGVGYVAGGGGGGSGGVTIATLSVTPGEKIGILVGNGSTATFLTPSGGQATTVSGSAGTVTALGGGNGGDATVSAGGSAGVAGTGGNNGTAGLFSATGAPTPFSLQGIGGETSYIATGTLSYGGGGDGGSSTISGAAGVVFIAYTQTIYTTSPTTTSVPTVRTVATGGWKQIVRGWLKENGVWQNIATPVTLTPSKSETTPTTRARINIVIASNTSSYDLVDVLNGTGLYYPGYSDITLTINAGVTVDSDSSGGAAITIDKLTLGDSLIIVNNGTILGRGGYGGAPGYLTTVRVGSGKNVSDQTVVNPAGAGGPGGTALAITYVTTLENNGNIYAGGGGGGGGGAGFTGAGVGQGGGGAGFGPGANAGTLTAGGAGAGYGGAGGTNGANGVTGTTGPSYTYSSGGKWPTNTTVSGSPGGAGGIGGKAITGNALVTYSNVGTIVGPRA